MKHKIVTIHSFLLFRAFGLLILFFSFSSVRSQESMLPDVSDDYVHKLIDTAVQYYPLVKANKKRIDIAQINLQKSQLTWLDVLSSTFNYSPTGGTTSLNQPTYTGFQVGIFVNIGALFQKPYIIKQAKEEFEISKLADQEYKLKLATDVKDKYYKYVQTKVMLRIEARNALEAETLSKEARYKFEKGETTFEIYSKALMFETDNKRKLIDAEANMLIARNGLESLVGKKLVEIN